MERTLLYNGATKIWSGAAEDRSQVSANQGDIYIALDTGMVYGCVDIGVWSVENNPHGYLLEAMTDPNAPAIAGGHLYIRDRGDGIHQLMCRFPSGAIQVVCTEP